jgi:tRNA (adenine57-N1/adenine58-N1)-methyltransferase
MQLAEHGDLALLVSEDYKRMIISLATGENLQTHKGMIPHDQLIGQPWGTEIQSHLGYKFFFLQPTLRDFILEIPRQTQIMYPKDIGYILLRLSIRPGGTVVEAGSGSGAMTMSLAWMVGREGKVISYERREDMLELAMRNIERVGLSSRVEFRLADIAQGFAETGVGSIFLDLPNPEAYLTQVRAAISNGGILGAILPTTNQVSVLVKGLREHGFDTIDVCEIMHRYYKPIPARLRPTDRMVAHTGYLVFSRAIMHEAVPSNASVEEDFQQPPGGG